MAMHPKRKQRLWMVLAIVIGASSAFALLFYALSDNLNLFYPPSEIVAGKAPVGKRIRAGGMVKAGSVKRQSDGLTVQFVVTDYAADVKVQYTGILPDLFAENDGVVVAGKLDENGLIMADEVLAKHDENYMPPEIAETLKKPQNDQAKSVYGYQINAGSYNNTDTTKTEHTSDDAIISETDNDYTTDTQTVTTMDAPQ